MTTKLVNKSLLICAFTILFFFFLFLDKSFSPDYNSYFRRFVAAEYYLANDYIFVFNFINYIFVNTNLNYDKYINLIFIIFSFLFFFIIYQILNFKKYFEHYNFIYILIFLILFCILFIFEFLIIRQRAGMSIVIMMSSFLFFLKEKKKNSIILLILAFFIHIPVTVIMFYSSFVLIYLVKSKKINGHMETLILFILSFLLLYIFHLLNVNDIRANPHLEKPLNIYRLLLYLMPILLIIKIHKKGNEFLFKNKTENFTEIYLKMFFFFEIALLFFFIIGRTLYSGQDIVRLFGLISLLIIFLNPHKKYFIDVMIFKFYLIIVNSFLFYKNFT
jgi:hypothetical protein